MADLARSGLLASGLDSIEKSENRKLWQLGLLHLFTCALKTLLQGRVAR